MTDLPPPQTFAEGERLIYGRLVAFAGAFCAAVAVSLIIVLVWGGWPSSLYGQIITTLGLALGGFIVAMYSVIVGLLVGGPVGRFKAEAGVGDKRIDLEADGNAP